MAKFVALHLPFSDERLKKLKATFEDAPNKDKHEVLIEVSGEEFTTTLEDFKGALLTLKDGQPKATRPVR